MIFCKISCISGKEEIFYIEMIGLIFKLVVFIMNSRQLQYAIALSQTLNFSQVADQLGISQPSLSKQILNLESELGIKLFDRNHSPMTVTPAGAYFLQEARELLYKEDQLYKGLDRFKSGENGRLIIGVTPFRSLYLMPGLVRRIKERYPGVQVVLHEANSTQLRKDAAEGKFDFAVVNLPVDESVLDVTPIEPDTLVLAVPKAMGQLLPENVGESVSFAQVRNLPFVVLGQSQELRQLFDKLCALADFHPNIAAEVVGVTTAWAMAHAGVGAALLPLQFVANQHFDENLILLSIKNIAYTRQPAIVTRRGQYVSDYARYAMDLLQENK